MREQIELGRGDCNFRGQGRGFFVRIVSAMTRPAISVMASPGPPVRIPARVGALATRVQIANSVDMMPGLRELIALTLLAGIGCGLALAHGDFLFVAVFGGAIAMTIETIRHFP